MEKLVYVLIKEEDVVSDFYDRFSNTVLPVIRDADGESITLLLPDITNTLQARNPGRIMGNFTDIAAVIEFWLPSVDMTEDIEPALGKLCDTCWGYLVSESTVVPCPHQLDGGAQVPGVTQFGMNDKPENVSLESFYKEWAIHSKQSFDLHPTRESYTRNAVFRPIIAGSPRYLGIVSERFSSIEDFVDDEVYFGDASAVQEMIEHLPNFFEFESAISGGMSEYRWR